MDLARTEIMKNRFSAMAEEAATVAYRTAHTTFVKQTQDFQVALARPSGEFFAYPMLTGVTSGGGQSIAGLLEHFADGFEPGDVVISNDPFRTGGLVTHMMDIHLARPVFYHDELICFAWSFVHASDIGGAVPGSISPELYEAFQEGVRLRPTKLLRAGVLNQDVVNILQDNSRIGDQVWGDLEAMMAAMRLLDRRAGALCDHIGVATFRQGIDDVMDYAETKARSVISGLRDGEYSFSDYLEGNDEADMVHIHCRLHVAGDEAEIDYSGSDPQVHAALNFTAGGRSHPFLCLGLTNYIQTMEPSIPVNGGMMRPIRAHAPPGTLLNAEFPAATGNRWVSAMRTYDALVGCVNQAIPDGITACGAGQAGIISVSWQDASSSRTRVAVVEPFSGGSGGRVRADGVDANDTMVGYLKSTPVEHVEAETPLLVRQHALVPSSFGHGRYRGGASVCIELECQSVHAAITVRGLDRFRFQPWGVRGGVPGRSGETWLWRDGEEIAQGRIRVLTMRRGDVLRMISPSGGGFGNPTERPPKLVLQDVANGLLDETEAAAIYGVVIRAGEVDAEATAHRRAEMAGSAADVPAVAHGPARRRYEAIWPPEASAELARAVLQVLPGLRRAVQQEARAALGAGPVPVETAGVRDVVASVARRLEVGRT